MTDITGSYDLVSTDNFDAYLKACGTGFAKRLLASTVKPTIEISRQGDVWTLKTISALKTTTNSFKSGVDFNEETHDGRMSRSTITIEGNKLVHIQRVGNDEARTERTFNGDQMNCIYVCNGVTATRVYARRNTVA